MDRTTFEERVFMIESLLTMKFKIDRMIDELPDSKGYAASEILKSFQVISKKLGDLKDKITVFDEHEGFPSSFKDMYPNVEFELDFLNFSEEIEFYTCEEIERSVDNG